VQQIILLTDYQVALIKIAYSEMLVDLTGRLSSTWEKDGSIIAYILEKATGEAAFGEIDGRSQVTVLSGQNKGKNLAAWNWQRSFGKGDTSATD
jgi:hypothetical protein